MPRFFAPSQLFRTSSTDDDQAPQATKGVRHGLCGRMCAYPPSQVASEAAFLLGGSFGVKQGERVQPLSQAPVASRSIRFATLETQEHAHTNSRDCAR